MKHILIAIIAIGTVFWVACTHNGQEKSLQASNPLAVDDLPGTSPFFTYDTKGNPVLSWARNVNDSSEVFCYSISTNQGRSFSKPIVVPGSENIHAHAENLPKIIFKPSGEIIALWGASNPNPKNKYSGLVFYAQSFDEGLTWTGPKTLVKDSASIDQRYYDVALMPNGEAGIIWLDNRKTSKKEGSALYFASTRGRDGFQDEQLVTESCCQCCRTDLFVDSKSGIHILYRGIIQDSIRDMLHIASIDNGKNFSSPKRISDDNWVLKGCPHTGPAMTENQNGLHFAWFTGGNNKGCYYANSTDNGKTFSPRNNISGLGSHPQITSLSGGELLVAWDETVEVNNQYYKRIGLQKRSANGAGSTVSFITPDTSTATYPVIYAINEKNSLVAYTVKRGEKEFIEYKVVGM